MAPIIYTPKKVSQNKDKNYREVKKVINSEKVDPHHDNYCH